MPILPQYERIPDATEGLPLYHKSPPLQSGGKLAINGENPTDLDLATYPPRVGPSNSREGAPVEYIFVPRWPMKGKIESALGILGADKEETIEIVQRAFEKLAEYPPGRVEFFTTTTEQKSVNEEDWSRILDEAWPRLQQHPPTRMKVMIADGPGDAERRKRRDLWIVLSIIFIPFGLIGVFIIIFLLMQPI